MFVVLFFLKGVLEVSTLWLIALVVIGVVVYALCLAILRDPLFFELCGKVFGKVFRRRRTASEENASAAEAEAGTEAQKTLPAEDEKAQEQGADDGKK